ncbi:hypothetical protein VspSTUT11_14930 [Vibrio sp. STUT-A11]|nr:hypothetical protein VspSTUT11_14930 [Vibrio sp. STUT-A11]
MRVINNNFRDNSPQEAPYSLKTIMPTFVGMLIFLVVLDDEILTTKSKSIIDEQDAFLAP